MDKNLKNPKEIPGVPEKVMVTLKMKAKDGGKKPFPIGQAQDILLLRNAQWQLDDENFTFNGKEISKK